MEIVSAAPPGDASWDDYVRRHPDGSIFHESAWTQSVRETYGHEAILLAARMDGRTIGVLPLFHVRSLLFGSRLVSTAFGTYGGILADGAAAADALADAARRLAGDRRAAYVELKSRRAAILSAPTKEGLYVTFRLPLGPDLDSTMRRLTTKMRQELRRAESKFRFDEGIDLSTFYRLHLRALRTHGTPPFPFRWFESLRRNLGARGVLLGARQEGEWLGAAMLFQAGRTLMSFYTAVPRENYKVRTQVALYGRILRMAHERGCDTYDLGRSKRGTGAFDAKSHWGIAPEPLAYQYLLPEGAALPDLNPMNPRYRPWIELWKRLPVAATRLIGPPLNAGLA